MKFTQDWFSGNIPNFEICKKALGRCVSCLEIGSFEGRGTCWMLENFVASYGNMVCVDTFEGGEEHAGLDLSDLRKTFDSNVAEVLGMAQTLEVVDKMSWKALCEFAGKKKTFNFIYVDGSHQTADVLLDACLSFKLLRPNGIILFDDYAGGAEVNPAVDAFLEAHHGLVKVILKNYQLAVQKV